MIPDRLDQLAFSTPRPVARSEPALRRRSLAAAAAPAAAARPASARSSTTWSRTVNSKEAQASDPHQQVLLGQSDQLHQSVIAMQEASVALSLMVQVRNKLVESYQELMRMQV